MSKNETSAVIPLLQAAYQYDPLTGHLTHRLSRQNVLVGTRAGWRGPDGYRHLSFRVKSFKEHRAIFAIVTGRGPTHTIDHINCFRDDNRWENLREATFGQNNANTFQAPPRSGFKGAYSEKRRWRALIKENGKVRRLGVFDTPEEAHAAWAAAARAKHPGFVRIDHPMFD